MSSAAKKTGGVLGGKRKLLKRRPPIGSVLVKNGLINDDQLNEGLSKTKESGIRLGKYLVSEGIVPEKDLAKSVAEQFDLSYLDLKGFKLNREVAKHIPFPVALQYGILPIKVVDEVLEIAVSDPLNVLNMSKIRSVTNLEYVVYVSEESAIRRELEHLKLFDQNEHKDDESSSTDILSSLDSSSGQDMGVIANVVSRILDQAMAHQASDIHIEPQEETLQVRERIDGLLEMSLEIPKVHESAVISRIKILANLDIAEKRKSQDGRFMHKSHEKTVDLRVSTLPTVKGEKIVIRILDKSNMKSDFYDLGISHDHTDQMKHLLHNPYGMVLITGPTGSGKTTTVYSMINYLNDVQKNIITVEDPVEYQFDMINQVQVNNKVGLNFSSVLKNILRQDPDIIMVGEIRDHETAEIAIRAALTGHLVISTVHTNNSTTAISRLVDIGVDPFLISSSLLGVISQRLVRRLCDHCKVSIDKKTDDQHPITHQLLDEGHTIYRSQGCEVCYQSGYSGREGVYEILIPNKDIKKAINEGQSAHDLDILAEKIHFQTMREDGLDKVKKGVTTVEEVLRSTM